MVTHRGRNNPERINALKLMLNSTIAQSISHVTAAHFFFHYSLTAKILTVHFGCSEKTTVVVAVAMNENNNETKDETERGNKLRTSRL